MSRLDVVVLKELLETLIIGGKRQVGDKHSSLGGFAGLVSLTPTGRRATARPRGTTTATATAATATTATTTATTTGGFITTLTVGSLAIGFIFLLLLGIFTLRPTTAVGEATGTRVTGLILPLQK